MTTGLLYKVDRETARKAMVIGALRVKYRNASGGTAPTLRPLFPHQIPPEGDWTTWLLLAGRGAGKTEAGARFVNDHANGAACLSGPVPHRIAIVAPSHDDAVDTCVRGETGILTANPRILFRPGAAKMADLTWPNGAEAELFGTFAPEDVERFRGPQHCLIWGDEFAAWRKLDESWDMIQFGLRLGPNPRMVLTSTPKRRQKLLDVLAAQGTVVSRAKTSDNPGLPQARRDVLYAMYGGTTLGRQELDAELIDDVEGALWTRELIVHRPAGKRMNTTTMQLIPDMARIVVGVDPNVSSGNDAAGIVIDGLGNDGRGYTLGDYTTSGGPSVWARRAVQAYHDFGADRIVAEANNGGDLVATVLRIHDPTVPVELVHASRGKRTRAEPVAALYEQGRWVHVEPFVELEDEMCLAGFTQVITDRGSLSIRTVRMGDRVLTRDGWRTVLWSGQTGVRDTIRVKTRAGILTCTGTHPVYVKGRGFVPAADIRPGDVLVSWLEHPFARSSNSTELDTSSPMTATTRPVAAAAGASIIGRSGHESEGQSRRDGTSTTGTTTGETTTSPTSSLSRRPSTSESTGHPEPGWSLLRSSLRSERLNGLSANRLVTIARSAGRPSGRAARELPTARPDASSVIAIERGFVQPVYNLTVHGAPEFYADGFLVHNCSYTGAPGEDSPDRMDAHVWAASALFNIRVDATTWGSGGSWGVPTAAPVAVSERTWGPA